MLSRLREWLKPASSKHFRLKSKHDDPEFITKVLSLVGPSVPIFAYLMYVTNSPANEIGIGSWLSFLWAGSVAVASAVALSNEDINWAQLAITISPTGLPLWYLFGILPEKLRARRAARAREKLLEKHPMRDDIERLTLIADAKRGEWEEKRIANIEHAVEILLYGAKDLAETSLVDGVVQNMKSRVRAERELDAYKQENQEEVEQVLRIEQGGSS